MLTCNLRGLRCPAPPQPRARKAPPIRAQPIHAHDARTLREILLNKWYTHILQIYSWFCVCPSSGCARALIPTHADGELGMGSKLRLAGGEFRAKVKTPNISLVETEVPFKLKPERIQSQSQSQSPRPLALALALAFSQFAIRRTIRDRPRIQSQSQSQRSIPNWA